MSNKAARYNPWHDTGTLMDYYKKYDEVEDDFLMDFEEEMVELERNKLFSKKAKKEAMRREF